MQIKRIDQKNFQKRLVKKFTILQSPAFWRANLSEPFCAVHKPIFVNRFGKIVVALALFVAAFATHLQAEAAVVENGAAPAQVTEASSPLLPLQAPAVFHLGPLPVTNSILLTWAVVLVIVFMVQFGTRGLHAEKVPTGLQNVLETLVEGWDSLSGMILEPKVSRWVFPYAVSFFVVAFLGNFVDLMPGVGSIGYGVPVKDGGAFASLPYSLEHVAVPFIRPPTDDANLTFVMASVFLVMTFVWAVRYNGVMGTIKHIFGVKVDTTKWLYPFVLLMFLFVGVMEAISIVFVRPLALAVRLYGNVFAGETLLDMTMTAKPFLVGVLLSLPFYFYEIFVAVVQAFVFAMLTIVFAGTLCSHADEEHGPESGH